MYCIAVCDDAPQDLEKISAIAAAFLKKVGIECCVERFRSSEELAFARRRGAVWDLILLDIMMEGQDGIELADALRSDGDETDLVFITNSPEYALAGYRSYPVSYLLKPVTREKLAPVLKRCLERRRKLPSVVLDGSEGGKISIACMDIRYIEVFNHELVVHCRDYPVSCTGSLGAVLRLLPEHFYRCHRSFLVNLEYVTGIQKYRFLLRGGGEVAIAMRSYAQAQERWLAFLQ